MMNNVATCVPFDPVHNISQQKVSSKHRWTWLIRDFGTILPQKSIPGCFEPVWTPKASAAKDHIDFCHAHDSIWADHPPGGQTSVEMGCNKFIWAMVNTHYMVDGHPIHNKDPYNCYYKSLWTIGWLAPINGY